MARHLQSRRRFTAGYADTSNDQAYGQTVVEQGLGFEDGGVYVYTDF